MKFFFRITDLNKVDEKFDIYNGQESLELVVKPPIRTPKTNGDRIRANRKRESLGRVRRNGRTSKRSSLDKVCDKKQDSTLIEVNEIKSDPEANVKTEIREIIKEINVDQSNNNPSVATTKNLNQDFDEKSVILDVNNKVANNNVDDKVAESRLCNDTENKENKNNGCVDNSKTKEDSVADMLLIKPDMAQQTKTEDSAIKNAVYTNITLKRTNNVEIITKIQQVSNKEGQPIGLNIIKRTVKKNNNKAGNSSKSTGKELLKPSDEVNQPDRQLENPLENCTKSSEEQKRIFLQAFELKARLPIAAPNNETDKNQKPEPVKKIIIQKRKNTSPVKNDQSKKPKLDKKPTKRIIIQCKPKPSHQNQIPNALQSTGLQTLIENCKIPSSLSITIKETSDNNKQPTLPPVKNYIEILKLPDETSSHLNTKQETKLEFPLKLCDNDSEQKVDQDLAEIARSLTEKIPLSTTISQIVGPKQQFPIPTKTSVSTSKANNILPSPVPELSSKLLNIPKDASKLTPRSPQTFQKIFEESIKRPDGTVVKTTDKDNQKIALDLSNESASSNSNAKRNNILEIASQLYKKTKMEIEKNHTEVSPQSPPIGKVPIPRLPQKIMKPPQKNLKFEIADTMIKYPQTVTNLHSNALGLNYTVSVGQNTSTVAKVNGTMTNIAKDGNNLFPKEIPTPFPRNLSPSLSFNSPRNSPKHSPKSSPMIKHMYAPTPNLLMDPLKVNTFSPKIPSPKFNDISKLSTPPPNKMSPSPKLSPKPSPSPSLSPKVPLQIQPPSQETLPGGSGSSTIQMKPSPSGAPNQMSPSQILEKYNIQNLAQLTASLNFNSTNFAMNPGTQLAALQHAMLLKHFEIQNRQNWLNMNQGPLVQYEKYLQSLKTNQNHLLGNIKDN